MAATLIGSALAGKALFKYNKKSFFLDRKLKQKRQFQEQDMRVRQFDLYREDVRDLVELTTSKMDLYMVVGVLLVDKCTMMVCKQNDALPEGSPQWAINLNNLACASAIFFLLLSLWLAMYASVSAQSFGTRLLTQFVRLPIAKTEQIWAASSKAEDYEAADVKELLRVPIFMAQKGDPTEDDKEKKDVLGSGTVFKGEQEVLEEETQAAAQVGQGDTLLPTAMLEHIRLYRKVQLNWQAFDAYARVSLFCGASCLLSTTLWWFLGNLVQIQRANIPAFGVAVIIAAVQVLLTRLDLRLRAIELFWIGVLMFLGTVLSAFGLIVHQHLADLKTGGQQDDPDWQLWMNVVGMCAFLAHAIQTTVMCLILYAAWPANDGDEKEAFLPGRFKSVLYLDVFGWLLNSGMPDGQPAVAEQQPAGAAAVQPTTTRMQSRRSTFRLSTMEPVGLDPALAAEANRLLGDPDRDDVVQKDRWSPAGGRVVSGAGSSFGVGADAGKAAQGTSEPCRTGEGSDATPMEVGFAANHADRNVQAAHASTFAPGPAGAPRTVHENVPVPGEIPWQAFLHGTCFIILVWICSTVWAAFRLYYGWSIDVKEPEASAALDVKWKVLGGSSVRPSLLNIACGIDNGVSVLAMKHASLAEVFLNGHGGTVSRLSVRDRGCGFRWPVVDTSMACKDGNCLAFLLRRGGRTVTVCHLARVHGGSHGLSPVASLRLTLGVESLAHIAASYAGSRSRDDVFAGLRVFGRTRGNGQLLALHASASQPSAMSNRPVTRTLVSAFRHGHLRPEFEIDPTGRYSLQGAGEHLFAVGTTVLSYSPEVGALEGSTCSVASKSLDTCDVRTSSAGIPEATMQLRMWDVSTGERTLYNMPISQPWLQDATSVFQQVCLAKPSHPTTGPEDFLAVA